jgi:hypothetical protein
VSGGEEDREGRAVGPGSGDRPEPEEGVGATDALSLRVSVGALVRVLFSGPEDGNTMLALERTATVRTVEEQSEVSVVAKPFGGGIRIVDPAALRAAIGDFRYDSERSREERDFRIQIHPASWGSVKRVCREHVRSGGSDILDTSPERELTEEFGDALGVGIVRNQYHLSPAGMLVEDAARKTDSVRAPGRPTVRVYYVFEAWLQDPETISSLLDSSRTSDGDLGAEALRRAAERGRGRANAALVLGLEDLRSTYLATPRDRRGEPLSRGGHLLAASVAAIVGGVDSPRYEPSGIRRG